MSDISDMSCFSNFVTTPCNPHASPAAKNLMAEIGRSYGKKIISGQMDLTWNDSVDMTARIFKDTGKRPKLMGFDFMNYTGKWGDGHHQTEEAIRWAKKGGYVQFCWHWYVKGPNGNWAFYSYSDAPEASRGARRGTDFKIPYDDLSETWKTDSAEYKLLLNQMKRIADELERLQKKNIPVLWRPLHEASGRWFWWGNSGAKSFIALWRLMYDYFTNTRSLNNLLWVWNGQAKEFYPGDDFVDFIGQDIYDAPKNYSSQIKKFTEAVNFCDNPETSTKMVALTENGTIPSPKACKKDGAMWAWFMTWNDVTRKSGVTREGNFWTGEFYNENSHKKAVYLSDDVITLEWKSLWEKIFHRSK